MIQLESLRKKEHFLLVLKQKAISNNFFSIYRKKNFIKKPKQTKIKIVLIIILLNSLAKYLFIMNDLIIFFKISFHI